MLEAIRESCKRENACVIVGLAFLWSYFHLGSYVNSWLSAASATYGQSMATTFENLYTLALCGCFLALFAIGTLPVWAFTQKRPVLVAAGCLGVLGQVLLFVGDSPGVAVGGLVLTAVFLSVLVMAWGAQSSRGEPRRVGLNVVLSYLLYVVVMVVFAFLPIDPSTLAPLVSTFALCLVANDEEPLPAYSRAAFRAVPWALVLVAVVMVYAATWLLHGLTGAFEADPAGLSQTLRKAFVLLIAVVLTLPLVFPPYSAKTPVVVFAVLFILYCVVLLLAYLFPDVIGAVSANKYFMRMYVWLALAWAVSSKGVSPYPAFLVFGVSLVALYHPLATAISNSQGFLYDFMQFEHSDVVLAVALFAVAVAGALALLYWCLHDKSVLAGFAGFAGASAAEVVEAAKAAKATDVPEASDAPLPGGEAPVEAPVEARVRKAVEDVHLTPREFDVAVLAYRGYSAKRIGEELVLAETTVRGHLTHVYQKVGVRTKQEFIDFVDAQAFGASGS